MEERNQDEEEHNYFYDMCVDIFGPSINASYTKGNNQDAQEYYGGVDSFDATNLCLPNGLFDPWHALGYYKADKDRNIVPVTIPGAAYCSDMYPEYDGEPAALPAARDQIKEFLSGIIYDADHPKRSSSMISLTVVFTAMSLRLLA